MNRPRAVVTCRRRASRRGRNLRAIGITHRSALTKPEQVAAQVAAAIREMYFQAAELVTSQDQEVHRRVDADRIKAVFIFAIVPQN